MIFTLAFRNLWRNKRRTLITAASVMFAVFFATFMQSIQRGTWDHMLNNVVNFYYGFVQVHSAGYWDDQSLDRSFQLGDDLRQKIAGAEGVEEIAPRIESFALASFGEQTTGVMVVGTRPGAEEKLTGLAEKVIKGKYWDSGSPDGILIAEGVARQLEMELGDTIVLISQGYHGANAAGKYPVTGILQFGSPELNKRMTYLPLGEAQYFFAADSLVTTIALHIANKEDAKLSVKSLEERLDTTQYEVMNWEQMIPDLVEARELDTASAMLVLWVLYLIIAFGIFGAILMMTRERQYEFGVLIAIGMKRFQLSGIVWIEIAMMGVMGTIAGMILAAPFVWYFHQNPINMAAMGEEMVKTYEKFGMEPVLPTSVDPWIFGTQAITVFLITTVVALYPLWVIGRLKPVEAMRT
ncbi:MAG: ABC transporter permease [Lewinella sp.]|nr:ABC transporter permease [Lewinella sp.]